MATTAVTAPAESTAQTRQERIDAAEQALGKADAAVARLRFELHSMPGRVRAVLEQVCEEGEPGRASAEQRLVALRERRAALPGAITISAVIAAVAEVGLRDLERLAAHEAYAQAAGKERALEPPPGVMRFHARSSRAGGMMTQAAARRASAQQASQTAAERLDAAKRRLAGALSAALE